VQHEREPLGGRAALDVRQLSAGGLLAPGRPRAQHVERHSSDNCGQPSANIRDLTRVGAAEPEPRFLHGIVSLGSRSEHPLGHRSQMRAVGLESVHEPIVFGHTVTFFPRDPSCH